MKKFPWNPPIGEVYKSLHQALASVMGLGFEKRPQQLSASIVPRLSIFNQLAIIGF